MHVRNHVAEAGQVDLVGFDDFAHHRFDCEDDTHQFLLFIVRQVGHLGDVPVEDDATEAGVIGIVNAHDPAERVFPEEFSSVGNAQFAGTA